MTRLRCSLFLLVIAALLVSGTPTFAGEASPVLPELFGGLSLEAGQCPAPASAPALGTPVESLDLAVPPSDFILCSCSLCKRQPDTICQISPSGYSILCSDWYATHC